MLKEVFYLITSVILGYVNFVSAENMVGPGSWMVISVDKCAEDSMFNNKFDITRRKMDRLSDGFTVKLKLADPIDEKIAIRIDVCKDAEGGCKPYQVLADESFINFANKFAEQNIVSALTLAGLDPPEFPLGQGDYEIVDYIFDYSELPEEGPYGIFGAQAFLIKDQREIGCVKAMLEFKEVEDGDDDE